MVFIHIFSAKVEQIERMAVDLVEEIMGFRVTGIIRFSDQCSAQFKVIPCIIFTSTNYSPEPLHRVPAPDHAGGPGAGWRRPHGPSLL